MVQVYNLETLCLGTSIVHMQSKYTKTTINHQFIQALVNNILNWWHKEHANTNI